MAVAALVTLGVRHSNRRNLDESLSSGRSKDGVSVARHLNTSEAGATRHLIYRSGPITDPCEALHVISMVGVVRLGTVTQYTNATPVERNFTELECFPNSSHSFIIRHLSSSLTPSAHYPECAESVGDAKRHRQDEFTLGNWFLREGPHSDHHVNSGPILAEAKLPLRNIMVHAL